jgi:glycosyltransferase involved in cell wall biosynthesis
MAGKWPLPILNYTSKEMTAAVARLGGDFDLVHLDSIHMMRYTEPFARPQRVTYNWHNIESEAMRRFAESTPSLMRRIYAKATARKLEALEREILANAFGHIVCSEREKAQLGAIAPSARVEVIENGVDCAYFAGLDKAPVRKRIVFVGKMDYHPNIEACVRFANSTWPLLRDQFKGFTLSIVGSSPAASVEALRNIPGVEVTGTVPDVRPYYRDALAAIVPLRVGGGTRLKILEAMAAGVPVISTSLGAEGLAVSPGYDILIAGPDDHGAWVRHLLDLRQSEERRQEITARAHRLVEFRYDWSSLRQSLIETYKGWMS